MSNAIPLKNQVIWLTGASSGIGEALAENLAPLCTHLYISARSAEKLSHLENAFSNITAIAADITDEASLAAAVAQIQAEAGRLDTVIANAGTCEYVDVNQFDTALFRRVLETNVLGLVNTVGAALPLLKQSKRGYIVGVSSSVAMLAMPRAQAYGSSKAAVTHFLESMKADLTPLGLDVSVVSPGFVKTPLTDVNDFPMPMRITADQAAKEIVKGLRKRTWHIHFPKRFTFILWMLGHLPAFLRHKITAAMSRSATNTQQESK
jgi:NADP-dependent 3-hydroxy acid dehydrogenase YdfG